MEKFFIKTTILFIFTVLTVFANCSSYESQFNLQQAKVQNVKLIDMEKAKTIVLTNSKIKENNIYNYNCELDYEDKFNPNTKKNYIYSYDIEFFTNNVKYKYKIDAQTGKIIEFEIETK